MKNKLFGLIVVVVAILFVASCGNSEESEPATAEEDRQENHDEQEAEASTDLGDYEVTFSGEVKEEENEFVVEGTSNLLPGSRLTGEVIVDDKETVYSSVSELVQDDGSFYMELDHHQYGEAEIIIRFDFESVQDDEIKRHYGEKGQNLEGPFIYKHETFDGILKKAEVVLPYLPNESNDLTIKAPDWYDLPEDYGDPRVWIDDVEITEDGEYFYIHGRSNLLEGSELRVEYRFNRGKTRVKPDGSFDFKIDYEYLEDRDFVITFDPSSFQWNEIEEAYGQRGQKLVGNLVVQDRFSDKQYIEKVIPWDETSAQPDSSSEEENDVEEEEDVDSNTEEEED